MPPFGPWPGVRRGGGFGCMAMSYGLGVVGTDDQLPPGASTTFWLDPTGLADQATLNQVREWPAGGAGRFVKLEVQVYRCVLVADGTQATVGQLIVTVDGADTAAKVTVFDGFTGRLQSAVLVPITAANNVGLRWLADPFFVSGNLRCTAMVCMPAGAPAFPPVLPGLGLIGLWETDPAVCIITKDGTNRISQVTDGSSNGRTMVQATAGRKPLYVAGAINSFAGLEIGADMERILEYSVDNLGLADGGPRTVMTVCKPAGAAGGSLAVFKRATNYFGMELWTHGGRQDFYGNGQFPTPVDIFATVPVDYGANRIVVVHAWDGVTFKARVNAVPITLTPPLVVGDETSVAPGLTLGNNNGVFGDRGFIGQCALWGAWDRDLTLTPADLAAAEAYTVKYL